MPQQKTRMDESWWVDYIEEEGDPSWRGSLDSLLTHSPTDRKIVDNLRKTRGGVWSADPINSLDLLAPENWQKQQQDKIMLAIEKTEMEPAISGWQSFVQKKLFWFAPKRLRWWQAPSPEKRDWWA